MRNDKAIARIQEVITLKSTDSKSIIHKILMQELIEEKTTESSQISYCACGFPVCVRVNGEEKLIHELTKQEVDFRSYREFFYCPNCERLLDTVQH